MNKDLNNLDPKLLSPKTLKELRSYLAREAVKKSWKAQKKKYKDLSGEMSRRARVRWGKK